ncbi:uridine kinase, partial [archaeon]|nr:uridine kinase [archaeon]
KILSELEKNAVNYLQQDSYYIDRSDLPTEERGEINFDLPESIDFKQLIKQLPLLKIKTPVNVPIYDFISHTRKLVTQKVDPATITIVEGILLFTRKELINLFDYKIYVETSDDIRFIRRMKRDLKERGRTIEMMVMQYLETVRPKHIDFVEPTKKYADIIIPKGGHNKKAMKLIINSLLNL